MKTLQKNLQSFAHLIVLLVLVCPIFAWAQTVQSIPLPSLPQNSKIMIWGDSVTETPAYYPRYIEGYVLACTGRQDLKFFTTGHSGATLNETISRQIDLQAFNPNIVMFLYGNNNITDGENSSGWDSDVQAAFTLYKGKGITAIIDGPGYADDTFSSNPSETQQQQQTLTAFSNIGHTEAVNYGEYQSDICDRQALTYNAAEAVLGPTYAFGVHFDPNGALMAAYEDIKTLGFNGNIGTITVDMQAGTASGSTGHTVANYSNGTVIVDSTIYPFCYNYDPSSYNGASGLASILPYLPFSQNLNNFTLKVANLGAQSANVTWGSQTVNFTSAQLAAGVNLPANFTSTPFDATFAQVMAAILDKQYFEDYETKYTSNFFGNDNGGNVDNNMIAVQSQLDAGVKALIVPVRHTISIVPVGASTSVPPVIIGTMVAYPTTGQSFSYQISALNSPTSYSATGLPSGLTINTSTGAITGTPNTTGKSVVTLTATNAYGTSLSTTLTLYTSNPVPNMPSITSANTATATVGVPFSYSIIATNNPTNYFVTVPSSQGTEPPNSSLPPGLTYNTYTGVISGTPTTAGTYPLQVAAMNSNLNGVIPFMTVTLTVNPGGGSAPPAPTGLTATAGSGQVSLSWSASAGATSYNVYRSTSSGSETSLVSGLTTTSYVDSSVSSGTTYYYTVAAVNSSGTSGYSNEASATPQSGLPSPPTNLTAVGGNDEVTLAWTASTGATSYNVYRGTLTGQETVTVATGVTTTSYVDSTVTNGPTYYYKVTATNSAGTSGYSNEASAATSAGNPPTPPAGLSATAGNTQISLSWTASSGATSYTLYRGTSSGSETSLISGLTTTTYTNTGLTNGTTYYYKVTATNTAGTSGYSNEASATPTSGGGGTTTYYQDSFSRTGDVTGSTPDVTDTGGATWSNSNGTGEYPISGGTASINPSAYSWSAEYLPVNGSSGVTVDGTKNFTLSVVVTPAAVSSARTGISLNTAIPGSLYSSDFAAMSTCSGFAGAYAFNGGTINYNYAAGITGATTISISYSASAGTLTYQVGSTTLYTQTGVTAAQVAAIRYITLGDDGYGGGDATPAPTFDNFTFTVGSGGGGSAPQPPTGLTATAGNAQVSLSWTASSGATSYSVYRSTTSGSETLLMGSVSGTTYSDTSVTNGTAYYYKVTATNSSGTSGYSNEANATPSAGSPPTAPTGLTATAGNTQISLSWTASSGATSYSVYRSTTSGSETLLMGSVSGTTYSDTSVTNGTAYYYKVTATNSAGTSGYSNEASATPTSGGGGTTTYYQDSFSRTGDMTGSTPDVTNTGGATWANQAGTGQYPISGGTASISPSAYSWSAEYLPVNGSSGVTLDGTKNFTLSVVVTPAAVSSARTGISLNTAVPGNLFSNYFAAMSTCSGFAGAYAFNGGSINYNYAAGITGATTISISYSASAGTVTYQVGSTTLYTQTGVTAAQVAAIRYITLGDDGYGGGDATPAPTFDNFTFTVGSGGGGSAPPAPTGLTATAGNAQVSLSWTASSGATSYSVYRSTTSGSETLLTGSVSGTTYSDTSVTNGTAYYYKVTATNSSGTSGYSNEANATPSAGSPPTAPSGLTATAGNTQISLSWTASSGATSYTLYRSTSSGSETSLISGLTSTTYTNTGLTNGTTYYYKVTATNSAGTSGYSNEASAAPTSGGGATTYYQDSFSRTGDITGSTPDVTNTGGATWANQAGTGQYPISGGTASINPSAYSWSAEYLPVNGSSGVTLDGTKNFTLSVVVTPAAVSSARTGISLNTAAPGNLYTSDFAAMSTCSGFAGAYAFNGGNINYNYAAGITGATTISISYSASAGTLTYKVGSTTLNTQTGVTAAQVAAVRYITLGDDGYGGGDATPAPTFDNFTLTVGP